MDIGKKLVVIAGSIVSSIALTIFLIATAPAINCFIGLNLCDRFHVLSYESDVILVYNWVLGLIAFAMTVTMVALLCNKKMKIYGCLLIPYIISLILVTVYAGLKIYYMGDGFIGIRKPLFSRMYIYKDHTGATIIQSSQSLVKVEHNGRIVFADNCGIGPNILYNELGICILRTPKDDGYDYPGIRLYNDLYYTEKDFYEDGHFDHSRVRFFDMDGYYVLTQEYGLGGFRPKEPESTGMLIKEYVEDVKEDENGIKLFKAN